MSFVAFHAPLKPPDDPIPSGDRTMARAVVAALEGAGLGDVRLVSRLRSRDGRGDAGVQDLIFRGAEAEIARLMQSDPPKLWVTYHSYYKAPDLLGPSLSRHWDVPYVLIEATRARKRLEGPYARFAEAAERACDAADLIFYLTELDRQSLERWRPERQRLARLKPFLNRREIEPPARRPQTGPIRLVTCAMFRHGDKLASFEALAAALALVRQELWRLTIIGDGPARADVRALFSGFGDRVTFLGALEQGQLADHFHEGDLFVWPGIGEAFGMVYLEAQAEGCPVLAENRPGVRDVVLDGGLLTPAGDAPAYAQAIERLAANPQLRLDLGGKARRQIEADHLLGSAEATIAEALHALSRSTPR